MTESLKPLPPQEPRVEFISKHRFDLELWYVMPLSLGAVAAPLYDHLPAYQLVPIFIAIFAMNWPWVWWLRPHVEKRIGVSRANSVAGRSLKKRPWSLTVLVWATTLSLIAIIIYLNFDRRYYPAKGWIEKGSGVWLCSSMVYCLYRAFDRTNYHPRRIWYGIAALILAMGFAFLGTSPDSYAGVLVLLGTIGIGLGLLDLGLMFHFASRSADGQEGRETEVLKQEDVRG